MTKEVPVGGWPSVVEVVGSTMHGDGVAEPPVVVLAAEVSTIVVATVEVSQAASVTVVNAGTEPVVVTPDPSSSPHAAVIRHRVKAPNNGVHCRMDPEGRRRRSLCGHPRIVNGPGIVDPSLKATSVNTATNPAASA